jgi:hypothetical protein
VSEFHVGSHILRIMFRPAQVSSPSEHTKRGLFVLVRMEYALKSLNVL